MVLLLIGVFLLYDGSLVLGHIPYSLKDHGCFFPEKDPIHVRHSLMSKFLPCHDDMILLLCHIHEVNSN